MDSRRWSHIWGKPKPPHCSNVKLQIVLIALPWSFRARLPAGLWPGTFAEQSFECYVVRIIWRIREMSFRKLKGWALKGENPHFSARSKRNSEMRSPNEQFGGGPVFYRGVWEHQHYCILLLGLPPLAMSSTIHSFIRPSVYTLLFHSLYSCLAPPTVSQILW